MIDNQLLNMPANIINNDMMKVSKRLGYKSITTTKRHYARFLKDFQEETCNQVMSFKKYQILK